MGALMTMQVTCDGWLCRREHNGAARNLREAKVKLRREGWTVTEDGEVYCPDCGEDGK